MLGKMKFKYFCWLLIASFYLLENCIQVSQNVLTPMMQADLEIPNTSFSTIVACYFWGYSFSQIPAGIIIDRYGFKTPLVLALLICGLGTIILANAHGFYAMLLSRTAIGIVSAFAALCVFNFMGKNFAKNLFATLTGLMLTIGMSGQIFGEAPLQYLATSQGWRISLISLGVIALLLALTNQLVLKKDQGTKSDVNREAFNQLIADHKVWLLTIYGMLRFTPFLLFVTFWGNPLITKIHGISDHDAAQVVGMLPLGFAIGAPIWGRISDKMASRRPGLLASNLLEITCWLLLLCTFNLAVINIIALLLGFGVSGFLPAFTIMKEISPEPLRTTALGFMNTLNSLGTPLMLTIIAYFSKVLNETTILLILPSLAVCAMIIYFIMQEPNKCQN